MAYIIHIWFIARPDAGQRPQYLLLIMFVSVQKFAGMIYKFEYRKTI